MELTAADVGTTALMRRILTARGQNGETVAAMLHRLGNAEGQVVTGSSGVYAGQFDAVQWPAIEAFINFVNAGGMKPATTAAVDAPSGVATVTP